MLHIHRAKGTHSFVGKGDSGTKAHEIRQPTAEQAHMSDSGGALDGQESLKPRLTALPKSCSHWKVRETHYWEENT